MLRAYFDDSGTHRGSHVVVWAGFIATPTEWSVIEQKWEKLLARYGISWFHARDIEHSDNECVGWSSNTRDAALLEFARLLSDSNICGMASTIRICDWNDAASISIIRNFPQPVNLGFEHCVQLALMMTQGGSLQSGVTQNVDFVFDCGAAGNREGAVGYDLARQYGSSWAHQPWFNRLLFDSVRKSIPLQAADLLAYETYRFEVQQIEAGVSAKVDHGTRRYLDILLENPAIMGQRYATKELSELSEQLSWGFPPDLLAPFRQSCGHIG